MFDLFVKITVLILCLTVFFAAYKCEQAFNELNRKHKQLIKEVDEQLLKEYDRGYSAGSREGSNKGYAAGWSDRGIAQASQELHGLW